MSQKEALTKEALTTAWAALRAVRWTQRLAGLRIITAALGEGMGERVDAETRGVWMGRLEERLRQDRVDAVKSLAAAGLLRLGEVGDSIRYYACSPFVRTRRVCLAGLILRAREDAATRDWFWDLATTGEDVARDVLAAAAVAFRWDDLRDDLRDDFRAAAARRAWLEEQVAAGGCLAAVARYALGRPLGRLAGDAELAAWDTAVMARLAATLRGEHVTSPRAWVERPGMGLRRGWGAGTLRPADWGAKPAMTR